MADLHEGSARDIEPSLPDVESLVGDHLDRQAATVDAASVLARLKAHSRVAVASRPRCDLDGRRAARRPSGISRRLALPAAAAAAVVAAFLAGRWLGPAPAGAEVLLRDAQKAHAMPVDRCYLIESELEDAQIEQRLLSALASRARLWTRGDRFCFETVRGSRRMIFGRDEHGRLWVTHKRDEGIVFAGRKEDVPEWLALTFDVCSMRVETLLDEVLSEFELRRRTTHLDGRARTHVIGASLAPGRRHANLLAATLEIDAETSVLRRVVLRRSIAGRHVATVTYTLVDNNLQAEDWYRLEAHLSAGAQVHVLSSRADANKVLRGPNAANEPVNMKAR